MTSAVAGLALAALLQAAGPQAAETLTGASAQLLAVRAVEGDSAAAVRARWARAAASLPDPRAARLGEAWLDLLTYRYEEADGALARLLSEAEGADPLRPWVLLASAEAELQRGRYPAAAARLREAAAAPDPPARALALVRLAGVGARLEGAAAAIPLLREAEGLLEGEGPWLRGLFRCARAGRFGGATTREDAEAGAALALEAGVRRLHAACRMLVAQDQHQRGEVARAVATYEEVEREQREARDRATRAGTLQWLGYVHLTVGDYGLARRRLQEAVVEGEATGSLSAVGWAHLNLSAISVSMGDLGAALEHAERAEALFEAQEDRWGLSALRSTRAQTATALGLWDEAGREYAASLEESRAAGNRAGWIGSRLSLAQVALARGDFAGAEAGVAEAYRLANDLEMPGWRYGVLGVEAELALRTGDAPRALAALETYLRVGLTPVQRYRGLARLAEALAVQGRAREAADTLDAALSHLEGWRAGLDEAALRRYAFQVKPFPEDPDMGVATVLAAVSEGGDPAAAFLLSERQRARSLLERLVRARAVGGGGPVAGGVREQVARPLPADSVAARLPPATALLSFVTGLGGEPTTAFLVQRSGLRSFRLSPADSLAPEIARWVRNAADEGIAAGLAERLGAALMAEPVAALDADVATLVVVPDGPLHRVPFGALRLPGGGWVARRYAVAAAPSAAAFLAAAGARDAGPVRILAFGDPAPPSLGGESAPPAAFRERVAALVPLGAARREAHRVARYAHAGRALVGSAASEEALTEAAGAYSVLHFATHALVDGASDDRMALVLAPGGGRDGIVGPGELASLDLRATRLAFLSACETTAGQVLVGEGVQGLTAPLLAAGVRTVVATAWKVEDEAAARLAEDFYRGLAEGLAAGESLRRAQAAAADRGAPMAEWGAFVLLGDPHQVVPLEGPRPEPLSLLALIALASAAAGAWTAVRLRRAPRPHPSVSAARGILGTILSALA